jgi:hypothetical protein
MRRHGVCVLLLAMFVVQLLGGTVFPYGCPEPCPDDTEESSCPPVCTVCTSCTHAQSGIVLRASAGVAFRSAERVVARHVASSTLQLTDDIFHVPLRG